MAKLNAKDPVNYPGRVSGRGPVNLFRMGLIVLTPEQIKILEASNLVVIIGMPAAGKSTVATYIAENVLPKHSLYSTDDYIDYGYEQSLYALMKDMSYDSNPKKIIEGVQGYRFLRKTIEREIAVDCIVDVQTPEAVRFARYLARGKKNVASGFEKNLAKVLKDYTDGLAQMTVKPSIITLYT